MVGGRRAIGVLGGTFDPPHIGHVGIAHRVRSALGLDEVLFVVAHDPWQKSGSRTVTAAPHRLAMVEAAVSGEEGLRCCPLEIERGGPSYTVDTLEELRRLEPAAILVLIVGADAAAQLDTWHRPEDLPGLARLAVVDRPGMPPAAAPPAWDVVHVEGLPEDISSSTVRRRVAAGEPVGQLVPDGVLRYIAEHGLYADGSP